MNKMDEMILVVKREDLFGEEEVMHFEGLLTNKLLTNHFISNIESSYTIMRRGDAEENTEFKQLIPYVIIKRGNETFLYKRLSGGGEKRLFDKLSIGVGGHMNYISDAYDFEEILYENLMREISEEITINTKEKINYIPIGLINDDSDEVGKVHIGLLFLAHIPLDAEVYINEVEQLQGEWITIEKLKNYDIYNKLENWSKISLESLDEYYDTNEEWD